MMNLIRFTGRFPLNEVKKAVIGMSSILHAHTPATRKQQIFAKQNLPFSSFEKINKRLLSSSASQDGFQNQYEMHVKQNSSIKLMRYSGDFISSEVRRMHTVGSDSFYRDSYKKFVGLKGWNILALVLFGIGVVTVFKIKDKKLKIFAAQPKLSNSKVTVKMWHQNSEAESSYSEGCLMMQTDRICFDLMQNKIHIWLKSNQGDWWCISLNSCWTGIDLAIEKKAETPQAEIAQKYKPDFVFNSDSLDVAAMDQMCIDSIPLIRWVFAEINSLASESDIKTKIRNTLKEIDGSNPFSYTFCTWEDMRRFAPGKPSYDDDHFWVAMFKDKPSTASSLHFSFIFHLIRTGLGIDSQSGLWEMIERKFSAALQDVKFVQFLDIVTKGVGKITIECANPLTNDLEIVNLLSMLVKPKLFQVLLQPIVINPCGYFGLTSFLALITYIEKHNLLEISQVESAESSYRRLNNLVGVVYPFYLAKVAEARSKQSWWNWFAPGESDIFKRMAAVTVFLSQFGSFVPIVGYAQFVAYGMAAALLNIIGEDFFGLTGNPGTDSLEKSSSFATISKIQSFSQDHILSLDDRVIFRIWYPSKLNMGLGHISLETKDVYASFYVGDTQAKFQNEKPTREIDIARFGRFDEQVTLYSFDANVLSQVFLALQECKFDPLFDPKKQPINLSDLGILLKQKIYDPSISIDLTELNSHDEKNVKDVFIKYGEMLTQIGTAKLQAPGMSTLPSETKTLQTDSQQTAKAPESKGAGQVAVAIDAGPVKANVTLYLPSFDDYIESFKKCENAVIKTWDDIRGRIIQELDRKFFKEGRDLIIDGVTLKSAGEFIKQLEGSDYFLLLKTKKMMGIHHHNIFQTILHSDKCQVLGMLPGVFAGFKSMKLPSDEKTEFSLQSHYASERPSNNPINLVVHGMLKRNITGSTIQIKDLITLLKLIEIYEKVIYGDKLSFNFFKTTNSHKPSSKEQIVKLPENNNAELKLKM